MGAGATASPYRLGERRRRAFELFLQGQTVSEVAEELRISLNTAIRYKKRYEGELAEQAAANPSLLRNHLENTVRALNELDLVRRKAWDSYEGSTSDQTRAQMLNIALKAQSERAKLFGLFGVKQEYFAHVQQVNLIQQRLLSFMARELCAEDRTKLELYITTELREFLEAPPLPALQAAVD